MVKEYKGDYVTLCSDLRTMIRLALEADYFASEAAKTPSGQSVRKGQILAFTRRFSRAVKVDSEGKFELRGSSNPVVKAVKPKIAKTPAEEILELAEKAWGQEAVPGFQKAIEQAQAQAEKQAKAIAEEADAIRKGRERARKEALVNDALAALTAMGMTEKQAKAEIKKWANK